MDVATKIEYLNSLRGYALRNGFQYNYFSNLLKDIKTNAKAIYHSNALEGSTVTYTDTLTFLRESTKLVELQNKYKGSEISDLVGLTNAVGYAYEKAQEGVLLTEEIIYYMYKHIVREFNTGFGYTFYRTSEAKTNYKKGEVKYYEKAHDLSHLMYLAMREYTERPFDIRQIAKFKLDFINIHPFADGNGRTSRLILNYCLIYAHYPPVIIKKEEKVYYIDLLHQ